jgi:arylsulfatase A-like enzyme
MSVDKQGMKAPISRRDFLRLAGLLPLSLVAPRVVNSLESVQQTGKMQNVVIVVFDAFSARNISMYGYQRETTPNLARLAERAIVYHNHHAGGNYTTPGTTSLLTGTLPWTHRAFQHGSPVDEAFVRQNIFTAFPNHYRMAYSHNVWVYTFLNQFRKSLDRYIPLEEYLLESDVFIPKLFRFDSDIATLTWNRTIQNSDDGYAYSLFLSDLYEKFASKRQTEWADLHSLYPKGITKNGHYPFLLEDAIDSVGKLLVDTKQPFMGYFHFFPPHEPYNTYRDYYGRFKNDGYLPVDKPVFKLLDPHYEGLYRSDVDNARREYDEFVLHVDHQFGRFYDHLEKSGLLENTWLILTSDHGEIFERSLVGHRTSVLYEPVIRIPLMIFEPRRRTRTDVHASTSAIDLLPTLLHVTGQQPAPWTEGVVLPPFSNTYADQDRNIYVLEAKRNAKYAPLTVATTTLLKENYKLMYFFGYEGLNGEERIELYNLQNDPEELNNLKSTKPETRNELFAELKAKLAEVNEPYQ